MTILIVDNSVERLEALSECLREFYPKASIQAESDAFEAGKFGMFHKVDVLFAELEAGRIDAIQLGGLIRHVNPRVKLFVTGRQQSLLDWEIVDEAGAILEADVSGVLSYPVTPDKLKKTINDAVMMGGAAK